MFPLWDQLIPLIYGVWQIHSTEALDEMVFSCLNHMFCSVHLIALGWHFLVCNILPLQKPAYSHWRFIVKDIYDRFNCAGFKNGIYVRVHLIHLWIFPVFHGSHEDIVQSICLKEKYIHVLSRRCVREHSGEIQISHILQFLCVQEEDINLVHFLFLLDIKLICILAMLCRLCRPWALCHSPHMVFMCGICFF